MTVSFLNDYIAGAHSEVLEALMHTNNEALSGYGTDFYTARAADKIRQACDAPNSDVYFIVGGTQTNAAVISTMLADWQGVISAATGHISVHEAGAIEYTGHKVLQIPEINGLMKPADIENYVASFYADPNYEHMVFPGMVYLSYPSELGTLYSLAELEEISRICKKYDMSLFIDGARLGYGTQSRLSDVTMKDIARLADVFYIGGTKMGALCGEAIVFAQGKTPSHFVTQIKRRGDLLAKGRLLGVQFDALFTNDLYNRIGRHANELAEQLT